MQVPEGWQLTSLKEVCNNQLQTGPFGSQLHSHEYVDEGVPVLMPKDLIDFRANIETAAKITEERSNSLQKHWLHQGDIVFSRRGDVARFALIDEKTGLAICGTGCLRARPTENYMPKYLSYFLQLHQTKKWLEQNAVGQTMPNMNTEILGELPLKLATNLEEQTKIAEILSTWDNAITTTEQLLANSQQQKKALMQQLLTGKKRLLDDNGQRFSGEWEATLLKEISKIAKGKALSSRNLVEGNYPVIAGGKTSPYNHNAFTHENIITVSASGAYAGFVAYHRDKIWASDCSVISNIESSDIGFIFYWLSYNQNRIYSLQSGGAQPHVYPRDLAGLKVLHPPLKEQQKIAAVLAAADDEIRVLEQKLDHLKQEKKALMQQLLTGKRRVQT